MKQFVEQSEMIKRLKIARIASQRVQQRVDRLRRSAMLQKATWKRGKERTAGREGPKRANDAGFAEQRAGKAPRPAGKVPASEAKWRRRSRRREKRGGAALWCERDKLVPLCVSV